MANEENIYTKLAKIQKELDCPKGQWNAFSSFNYRSCEDILKAVKPLLNGLILTITDEIVEVGGRVYVKSTVVLCDPSDLKSSIGISAFAREEETKKGMDAAQITGSASSYARKYALNGLFAIDDTRDADTTDNMTGTTTQRKQTEQKKTTTTTNPGLTLIKSITQKKGNKKDGSTWIRYKITDTNGKEYATFSKTHADIAKIARDKKAECLITHATDQYKTIELIEMQDPNAPTPEDVPDEDIPF